MIGLGSSGPHSNGYSLIRRIVELSGLAWDAPAPFAAGQSLAEALMTPTRIYIESVLPLAKAGLIERLRPHHRRRPDRKPAARHRRRASPPASTGAPGRRRRCSPGCAETGGVAEAEMRRTFNCGLGLMLIVSPRNAEAVLAALLNAGETAFVCGELMTA